VVDTGHGLHTSSIVADERHNGDDSDAEDADCDYDGQEPRSQTQLQPSTGLQRRCNHQTCAQQLSLQQSTALLHLHKLNRFSFINCLTQIETIMQTANTQLYIVITVHAKLCSGRLPRD